MSHSPAVYDSPSPSLPRVARRRKKARVVDLEREPAHREPKRRTAPPGSVTSSVPPSRPVERPLENDAVAARSSERLRARSRLRADAHRRTLPSPGTNGGLWWNGTRFSQSRSACQWISAITCSGMQRVAQQERRRGIGS